MINNKHGVVKVKNSDHMNKLKGYGASFLQKKMFRLFLVILWLTLFGGCAVTNEPNNISYYMGSNEISELNEKILSQAQMSSEPGDILIGEGDLLQISVFEAKELDKTVRVNSRGFISLPLIGEVRVSGLTAIETEEKIEEMYETRFIKDPHVSIFVEEQISQRITSGRTVQEARYIRLSLEPEAARRHRLGRRSERAGRTDSASAQDPLCSRGAQYFYR